MATARWFYNLEPDSKFVIQEHLRQDYWRVGPATMWIDAVQSTPPYKAVGYWREANFELEWMPRSHLLLRVNRAEPELVRATSLQLGLRPYRSFEEGGQFITEWRVAGSEPPEEQVDSLVGATPVLDVNAPA